MLKKQNRLINNSKFNFIYFKNQKINFKKKSFYTEDFKIEKYSNMNNIQDLSKIRDNFLKLRIVVSVKNIKLASDRNKIKRRIKYFFIENYIKKQNNLTNKQEYFFITILKKQKEILNYKEIERQLNSML